MKAEHDGFQKVSHLLFEESIFSLQVLLQWSIYIYICFTFVKINICSLLVYIDSCQNGSSFLFVRDEYLEVVGKKNPPFRFSGIEEESCWCSSQLSSISQFWYLIFSVSLTCYGICEAFLIRSIQHSSKETCPNPHFLQTFWKENRVSLVGSEKVLSRQTKYSNRTSLMFKNKHIWKKEFCIFVCLSLLS